MCLDLKELELKYKINDRDHGKAFDIDSGLSWRACVSFCGGGRVQLLQYHQK